MASSMPPTRIRNLGQDSQETPRRQCLHMTPPCSVNQSTSLPLLRHGSPTSLKTDFPWGSRWKKIYRGRVWYGQRGAKKTDTQAYQVAVNSFQEWKQTADADADAHKPHADQYHQAIGQRQAMLQWLLLERDNREEFDAFITINHADGRTETISGASVGLPTYDQEHDRLVGEIDRLKTDFARLNPPELDRHDDCVRWDLLWPGDEEAPVSFC